jgi:hypothetical protein
MYAVVEHVRHRTTHRGHGGGARRCALLRLGEADHPRHQAYAPAARRVRAMLSDPRNVVPTLVMLASAPFYDADGNPITTPGFHAASGTWLRQDVLRLPALPTRPGRRSRGGA